MMNTTTTLVVNVTYVRIVTIVVFALFALPSSAFQIDFDNIPERHQQLIIVNTDGWDDQFGTLEYYEMQSSNWVLIQDSISVVVGKNGMAWGSGVHVGVDCLKREGDGRAPAGAFNISTSFGYSPNLESVNKFPYMQITTRDYYIDDPNSSDYNMLVSIPESKPNNPKKYWKSFEKMRRSDHLYELGIMVRHNKNPIVHGEGSAIFLHIWRNSLSPTLGCTAMSKQDLENLIKWLDLNKKPLLIQAPIGELSTVVFP